MSVRRNLAGILAGILAAPLLLSACGGGDDSVADPPISSAPTSSATGTPQRESAEHFIQRWTKEEARMENTGEADVYLSLSHGCDACRTLARKVRQYYAAGGFVHWGGWRILSIDVNSRQGDAITFAVRNRSMPTRYKASNTAPLRHFPGGVTTELLQVKRTADSWNLASKAELAS